MEKFDKIALGIILMVPLSEILLFFSLMGFREIGLFQLTEILTWILFSNFLLGWYFLFGGLWTLLVKILPPIYDMNLPYNFSYAYIKTGYIYPVFCILGWLSVPIIVKYSNGLHPVKRLVYIYILPQLVMGIALMLQFPFY
ncbi:hypothetical protein C5S31_09715 [ANME-1 cluster archaeon GoMg2]|nr:hypothetical protein [ANME-1 cluster archaeon GoMg2]